MTKILLLLALLAAPVEYVEITVKPGDSLSKISARYLEDPQRWRELLQYNDIDNPNLIRPGLVLKVPIQMASEKAKEEGVKKAEAPKGPSKSAWRVTGVRGTVMEVDGSKTRKLNVGSAVEPGLKIQTGEDSFASFKLPDDSTIRMESDTLVHVTQTEPAAKGGWKTKLKNLGGFLRAKVSKLLPSSSFDVETPTAVAGVRGTEFSVAYDEEKGISQMAVEEGEVAVEAEGKKITLKQGQGTIAKKGKPPEPPVELLDAPRIRTVQLEDGSEALEWVRPGGAQQCGFVIAQDADFSSIVRQTTSMSDMGSSADIGPGDYHARAFCIDQNGLRGKLSEPIEFTLD